MNEENIILRGAAVESSLIGSTLLAIFVIHFTNMSNRFNGIASGSGTLYILKAFWSEPMFLLYYGMVLYL
ncbi:hypothetical protein COJ07_17030 [Bacillus cereus]|uniref:Uncharacterized protein n=1 Tax=Bacillus cereus TaxID=1396 RepID=A0A2B0TS74_BACCE|nr:hypothetical protein [Bacillus cereus]PFL18784.1 hypothetical protein COJ07_17030 [Bacillus cereus]PFU43791.1 hypothetical protein COK86_10110 [Bacillus cereus]